MPPWRRVMAIACLAGSSACASVPAQMHARCIDADEMLAQPLARLTALRAEPGACVANVDACHQLRERVEQLALTCPTHVPTLLANAVLSHEEGNVTRADEYLDIIFTLRTIEPDAAALRARMALDNGNVPFALRFASEQIALSPAHAGLHETYAAALFAARRYDESTRELTVAAKLGAPAWRIAYGQGLIAEALGQHDDAERAYERALTDRPGWPLATARLRALRVKNES